MHDHATLCPGRGLPAHDRPTSPRPGAARIHTAAAALLLAVLAAACSAGTDQLTRDALEAQYGGTVVVDGDTFTVTDDTGSMRVAPEVPAGLEAPVLNRWIHIAGVERGGEARPRLLVELSYGPDRYDDIITFYEAWAAGRSSPVTVTTSDDFLTTSWLADDAGGTVVEVTLTPAAVTVKIAEGL